MWWLLKPKKKTIDPDRVHEEHWEADFTSEENARFEIASTEEYQSRISENGLEIEIEKKNLFVWAVDKIYRYRDALIECDIELDAQHSAAGFLLKHNNDENFYYFLISNHGQFRFDLVFNGHPSPLVTWTEFSKEPVREIFLVIIMRDSRFCFYINGKLAAEVDDDRLDVGRIAFGLQNYDESSNCKAVLKSFFIDSRPAAVETASSIWEQSGSNPDGRISLASTLMSLGQSHAAAIQLKKALAEGGDPKLAVLMLSEALMISGQPESALNLVSKSLEENPDDQQLQLRKADALYLTNNFIDLYRFCSELLKTVTEDPVLWNLLGHASLSLGKKDEAAEAYRRAAEATGRNGDFYRNEADVLVKVGKKQAASEAYKKGAEAFYRSEDYTAASDCAEQHLKMEPDSTEGLRILSRASFAMDDYKKASAYLEQIGSASESDDFFLYGLIKKIMGKADEAERLFNKAIETSESPRAVYYLRAAENAFDNDKDASVYLEKALLLEPDNAWGWDLAGRVAVDNQDWQKCLACFKKAFELSAGREEIIRINYAQALDLCDLPEEGKNLLKDADTPETWNALGVLATRDGKPDAALDWFRKAFTAEPENTVYLMNAASAALDIPDPALADELAVRAFDISKDTEALVCIAHAARGKGQYDRAVMVYDQVLELDDDSEILAAKIGTLIDAGRLEEAAAILNQENDLEPEIRQVLESRLKPLMNARITCSGCGRVWWVPHKPETQGALKVVGEPSPEAPAGRCGACLKVYCVACASKSVKEERFVCVECEEPLKLNTDQLKWLMKQYL